MADPLLERARRTLGDRPVSEAVERARAIIGVPRVPDSEKAAQAALEKLQNGDRPTAQELAALELVVRLLRPAPLSKHGDLPPLPPGDLYPAGLVEKWESFRSTVKPFLYSIGRLDRTTGASPALATGFLVGPGLLLTNRHVVDDLSYGAGAIDQGQAVVRFQQEYGCTEEPDATVPVLGVVAVHEWLDMALLRIGETDRPALPIADAEPAAQTMVAAVGYPQKDPKSPLFAPAIFNDRYGTKRAAIGEVLDARPERLLHDCSTLGGNSGSPVLALEDSCVVGLHFTGIFMYRNEAVPAPHIAAFVSDHG